MLHVVFQRYKGMFLYCIYSISVACYSIGYFDMRMSGNLCVIDVLSGMSTWLNYANKAVC